ncbi:MAG: hypothetical protein WD512_17255 [Candidatus Paceibacterota bacterium]
MIAWVAAMAPPIQDQKLNPNINIKNRNIQDPVICSKILVRGKKLIIVPIMGISDKKFLANIKAPILKGPGGIKDVIMGAKSIRGVEYTIIVTILGSPMAEKKAGHKPYKNLFPAGISLLHFSDRDEGTV